jgi:transposase
VSNFLTGTLLRSDVYDGSISSRAQIVLWYYEGRRKSDIAKDLETTRPTVDKWIKRYEQQGVEGLVNRTSPGGPRQIPDHVRATVLAFSRTTPPAAFGNIALVILGHGEVYQGDGRGVCVADLGVTSVARA